MFYFELLLIMMRPHKKGMRRSNGQHLLADRKVGSPINAMVSLSLFFLFTVDLFRLRMTRVINKYTIDTATSVYNHRLPPRANQPGLHYYL